MAPRPWIITGWLVAIATPATADTPDPSPPTTVTIGAYVETYYQLNVRRPSNHLTNLRGFDNRDRTFTLANAAVDVKGVRGPVTAHVVLQVGTTGATYYLVEPTVPGTSSVAPSSADLWRNLQTATIAYAGPGKLVIDAGLIVSPIGPEVIPIKDNWNWSRSNLFFGLPFYHVGARVAYPLGGGWTGMLHIYNGWNSAVDTTRSPSVALSAGYATPQVTAQILYFGGVERTKGSPEGAPWRNLLDAYVQIAVTEDVSVLAHADGGIESNTLGTSGWVAFAGYAKFQLAPTLYGAVRGDWFRESIPGEGATRASAIFFPTAWIASGTATLALQPADGLSLRLEYRHDQAKDPVFFGGHVAGDGTTTPFVPNRRAQDTVTVGAVASF